jgi:hypothetical protein
LILILQNSIALVSVVAIQPWIFNLSPLELNVGNRYVKPKTQNLLLIGEKDLLFFQLK